MLQYTQNLLEHDRKVVLSTINQTRHYGYIENNYFGVSPILFEFGIKYVIFILHFLHFIVLYETCLSREYFNIYSNNHSVKSTSFGLIS